MSQPDITLQTDTFDKLVQIPVNYFNQPIFQIYLAAISEEINDIYKVIYDLRFLRLISSSTGVNLDNVGQIVGEPRKYSTQLDIGYFTFSDNPMGSGFDDGMFWSPEENSIIFETREDSVYRKNIISKVIRNNGNATPEEIIEMTKILTGSTHVDYVPDYPAGCKIYYDAEITNSERSYTYDFIQAALPTGVKLTEFNVIT